MSLYCIKLLLNYFKKIKIKIIHPFAIPGRDILTTMKGTHADELTNQVPNNSLIIHSFEVLWHHCMPKTRKWFSSFS